MIRLYSSADANFSMSENTEFKIEILDMIAAKRPPLKVYLKIKLTLITGSEFERRCVDIDLNRIPQKKANKTILIINFYDYYLQAK